MNRGALVALVALSCAACGHWKQESEKWRAEFNRLNEEVKQFRQTLPQALDKIDPLYLKESNRTVLQLKDLNQKLQEALRAAQDKIVGEGFELELRCNTLAATANSTRQAANVRIDILNSEGKSVGSLTGDDVTQCPVSDTYSLPIGQHGAGRYTVRTKIDFPAGEQSRANFTINVSLRYFETATGTKHTVCAKQWTNYFDDKNPFDCGVTLQYRGASEK